MVFQRWPVIIAVCMWVCVCTRLCVCVRTHVRCVWCMAACAGQRITIIPSVLATFSSSDFIFIIILYICDNGDTSLCRGACGGQRITFGSQFTSSTWVLRSNSGWQAWWQSPFPSLSVLPESGFSLAWGHERLDGQKTSSRAILVSTSPAPEL